MRRSSEFWMPLVNIIEMLRRRGEDSGPSKCQHIRIVSWLAMSKQQQQQQASEIDISISNIHKYVH